MQILFCQVKNMALKNKNPPFQGQRNIFNRKLHNFDWTSPKIDMNIKSENLTRNEDSISMESTS